MLKQLLSQSQITDMLELQFRLNSDTNGPKWISGTTKEGKSIDWNRCIYMEAAELIGSLPWKHWKGINDAMDFQNVKVEVVDIWHFVMSQSIFIHEGDIESASNYLMLVQSNAFKRAKEEMNESTQTQYAQILKWTEEIIKRTIYKEDSSFEFFSLCARIEGFSMLDLKNLYYGKNALNIVRQKNGYKDGSYIKIWDGKEDNVFMADTLASNDISFDELMGILMAKYDTVKALNA